MDGSSVSVRSVHEDESASLPYRIFRKLYPFTPRSFDRLATWAAPRVETRLSDGLVGEVADQARALELLRRDGLAVFSRPLDPGVVRQLRDFAERSRCIPQPGDGAYLGSYEERTSRAARCNFAEVDLLADETVQLLVADSSLRCFSAAYLGVEPVNDLVAMWWSFAREADPSSEAAQLFHTDRDRVAFLKFFIYLTDVDGNHGPHVFVRGSHRRRPMRLRKDRRFTDAEVLTAFPASDVMEVAGPAGTVFVADTRGLHKGLPPRLGNRLVLQVQFTTSLFGAPYVRVPPESIAPPILTAMSAAPRTYRRFLGD